MHEKVKNHKKKKKLGLFYGISISLLLIAFMALFYFLVLVSSKPKSIPYVTHKIQETLKNNFGSDSDIDQSFVSFTRYGTLKIAATNLRIYYVADLGSDKKTFLVPRVEAEFPVFDLLLFKFYPKKFRLISPDIVIADLEKFKPAKQDAPKQSQIAILLDLFSTLQKTNNNLEFIEIDDASLTLRTEVLDQKILLKKTRIHLEQKNNILNIEGQNQINFDPEKSDVSFSFECQMPKNSDPRCDASVTNFSPDSISDLHPSLKDLAKISALFEASASLNLKGGELDKINFKIKSDKGNFEFLEFFSSAIDFTNFNLSGLYDYKAKTLNLTNIETDFVRVANGIAPHLTMSFNASSLGQSIEEFDIEIKLNDFLGDELAKYWPINLNQNDIRTWAVEHIKGGVIKNAQTKFSLSKLDETINLDDITAQVNFSALTLNYDENFPAITNAAGTAQFSKKSMNITINEANVLQSKISNALVAIDDFDAANILLKIAAKVNGNAADGLKHANNTKDFHAGVEKYLNGKAQSSVDVQLSLSKKMNLKNSYIAVSSVVSDLNNDYVRGSALVNTHKDFNSNSFITTIDLSASEISAKSFDINKKISTESSLDFALLIDDENNLWFKNILLISKEPAAQKDKFNISKISGNLYIKTSPFLVSQINLKNQNFGKNNYNFSYQQKTKNSPLAISINGDAINFGALVENKFFENLPKSDLALLKFQVSFKHVDLMKNKSLRNLSMTLECGDICTSGVARASYANKQMLNFIIAKAPKNDFSTIEGRVTDVGYLAEGLGISNVVSGGDFKVKMKNKLLDRTAVLEGEAKLNDKITIFESATVKRFAKDTLFSAVKDKIFSSEKTIFDTVKIEFDFKGSSLNIKSLIANNYKIGVTAKGVIDLKNDSYNLKGMIIPGFIINNLFGLGNIPVLGSLLTGGEGGGVFGLRYEYVKSKDDKEGKFTTNKVTSFVPSTIQNLFDF